MLALRLRLRSYSWRALAVYSESLVLALRHSFQLVVAGPTGLPTKLVKFTLNKSPHVNKKSGDQLEIRTHAKLISVHARDAAGVLKAVCDSVPEGVFADVWLAPSTR